MDADHYVKYLKHYYLQLTLARFEVMAEVFPDLFNSNFDFTVNNNLNTILLDDNN
jgi:hypothetical protein